MKISLRIPAVISAVIFASSLWVQAGPSRVAAFDLPVADDLVLNAQIDAMDTSSGSWKPMVEKLERTGDGFAGSFVTPAGNDIRFECKLGREDGKATGTVKWESSEEIPSAFLLLTLIIPMDQVTDAMMTSGDQTISFEKMAAQVPTRNNFAASSGFSLSPLSGQTLEFSFEQPSDVQALILGENMYIRINLTPQKEPIAASGTAGWSVGKQ